MAGVIGGAIGAATGFLSFAAGSVTSTGTAAVFERAAKHAFADMWMGGVKSAIYGGESSPIRDMIGGALSSVGNGLINDNVNGVVLKTASAAVLGGTISEIGGGKFANGAITGAYGMLFNDMMHEVKKRAANKLDKSLQNDATRQFIAIVVGESTNNTDEAAAIGSVMMNRLDAKNATLSDGFVSKIGGAGQYDAIGGKAYNSIMKSSWDDILSSDNIYYNRIAGAIMSLSGTDYSCGAYIWNASTPRTGFNWRMYDKGVYKITTTVGGTTFFRYSNSKKTWP